MVCRLSFSRETSNWEAEYLTSMSGGKANESLLSSGLCEIKLYTAMLKHASHFISAGV